jgi:serine/threonine protein kinase
VRYDFPVPGYEVISEISRGGMGVVYRAVQVALGREVALKIMLDPDKNLTGLARFEREGSQYPH